MRVVLLSTYELGRQPFGLASPAAWLHEAGASVACNDIAVERLNLDAVRQAGLIAVFVPMHTATRLAARLVPHLKALNGGAHLCFYGLYAPMNEGYLRALGADSILGGEFESGLVSLYRRLAFGNGTARDGQREPVISLAKQRFRTPDRHDLPALTGYAHLRLGQAERRTVGYTEASRGCKHLCRHCPVVPVYGGRFRVIQPEVVIEDIRQQVAAGARHITFGDPDFFNGVGHALRIARTLAERFPGLTYDVTAKIEHLLEHARHLATLSATGCLFVTTAVESVDDHVLALLDKGHTRADFIRVVALAREAGLSLAPTFIPFLPWTSLEGYLDLLRVVARLDLIDHVAPVQLTMRLLVPRGSRLLELAEMNDLLGEFDAGALSYRWEHADKRVARLWRRVRRSVEDGETAGASRREAFARIWRIAHDACDVSTPDLPPRAAHMEAPPPRLSEPWYCCAEPTADQLMRV